MQKPANPFRLVALASVAVVIAGALGWSRRDLWLPSAKPAPVGSKSPTSKARRVAKTDSAPESTKHTDNLVSVPRNSTEAAAAKRKIAKVAANLDPTNYGFAGRVFMAMDADHDGRLKPSEIPERFRPHFLHAMTTPTGLDLTEFLKALAALPVDRDVAVVVPTTTVARGPLPNVPVYRPKTSEPARLPSWFMARDKNGDGQVSLSEWPAAELARFHQLDVNHDGFLTPEEVRAEK